MRRKTSFWGTANVNCLHVQLYASLPVINTFLLFLSVMQILMCFFLCQWYEQFGKITSLESLNSLINRSNIRKEIESTNLVIGGLYWERPEIRAEIFFFFNKVIRLFLPPRYLLSLVADILKTPDNWSFTSAWFIPSFVFLFVQFSLHYYYIRT